MSAAPEPRPADGTPAGAPAESAADTGPAAGDPAAGDPAAGPPSATARAGQAGRRSLAAAWVLGVAGAALAFFAAGRTWAEGTVALATGSTRVAVEGQDVTAVPSAMALVGLAALVAVMATRRAGRLLVSALLAFAGAAALVTALLGAGDTAALEAEAARAAGLTAVEVTAVARTAWPWAAATGGALLLAAGLLAVLRGRLWPGMSSRYDAPGAAGAKARRGSAAVVDPERPEDVWKALDRGEDPTDTA
ncbi:TIGR02234 family membrane protein [Streptomyces thermolineatus]|uniref:TIGR02234 family membrane protein n=1 Tax=Streptomyces thermolineatus TaxID=44033 RepID=UPI003CD085B8